jgi:hypothetical protein
VAGELRATHVALAPHVRDPENKIKVTNAVCINTEGEMTVENASSGAIKINVIDKKTNKKRGSMTPEQFKEYYRIPKSSTRFLPDLLKEYGDKNDEVYFETALNSRGEILNIKEYSMDPKELAALVKNAVDEAIAAKNGEDRMDAMEETLKAHGDTLNEIGEKLAPKKEEEPKTEGENAEGEEEKKDEKEGATLENAKPSQEMVKAFSTALNVDFGAKTPSFATLAALSGLSETDPALRIAAVNTKFAEMQKNAPKEKEAAAQNAAGEVF